MVSLTRTGAVVLLLAVLAGCAVPIGPTPAPPVPPTAPPQPTPPATAEPEPPGPAPSVTLALVQESDVAREHGDYEKAVQLLERAIRIEPDRPDLWIGLATAHLEQGDYDSAEQFARKALLFTGTQYGLEQRAWSVIGAAEAARREDRRL